MKCKQVLEATPEEHRKLIAAVYKRWKVYTLRIPYVFVYIM